MSHPEFESILDGCVAGLLLGESTEECLAEYPRDTQALGPLVNLAAEIIHLPPMEATPEAVQRGRSAMFAALPASGPVEGTNSSSKLPLVTPLVGIFKRIRPVWTPLPVRAAMVALLAFFLSAFLVTTASATSLPGERLYPLKRSLESARRMLILDDQSRQEYEGQLETRRREEVRAMVDLGRSGEAEFAGQLETYSENAWLIDGLKIVIDGQTSIAGELAPGQKAQVVALVQEDGTLRALMVEVEGEEGPDGMGTPADTPTPAATDPVHPTPTMEPTNRPPDPTWTPLRTDEPPEPTRTVYPTDEAADPTQTPQPTDRPLDPTPTPHPVDEPHDPTATPHLSDSAPEPTHTPRPTERPLDPTQTAPANDSAPEPTHTPHPTERPPEPTQTPRPTDRPADPTPTARPGDLPAEPTSTKQPSDSPHDPTPEPDPTEPTDQTMTRHPEDRPPASAEPSDDTIS